MISHTVYRERNNEIILQLQAAGAPLAAPDSIASVEVNIGAVWADTASSFITYDDEDGTLTLALGRVAEFAALPDGVYQVEVTGFAVDDEKGIAFGFFLIYLRDWGVPNGS